jgi:hypothetical protein
VILAGLSVSVAVSRLSCHQHRYGLDYLSGRGYRAMTTT